MSSPKKNKPVIAAEPTVAYITAKGKATGEKKTKNGDWAESLTEKDLELIARGSADIKKGRIYSHTAALKKIKAHIKAKTR